MRDLTALRENLLLAVERVAGDAAIARGAEEALWCVTRFSRDPTSPPYAGSLRRRYQDDCGGSCDKSDDVARLPGTSLSFNRFGCNSPVASSAG
jgi:hypothetical protein